MAALQYCQFQFQVEARGLNLIALKKVSVSAQIDSARGQRLTCLTLHNRSLAFVHSRIYSELGYAVVEYYDGLLASRSVLNNPAIAVRNPILS